jgi:hypothetical protein
MAIEIRTASADRPAFRGGDNRFQIHIQTGSDEPAVVSVRDNSLTSLANPTAIYVHPSDNVFAPSTSPGTTALGLILDIIFDRNVGSVGGMSFSIAQDGMTMANVIPPG